jgi:hypothetical protein
LGFTIFARRLARRFDVQVEAPRGCPRESRPYK